MSSLNWRLAQRLAVSSWQELMRVRLLKVVQENSVLRPAKVYWRTWRGWYILRRHSMRPYLTQQNSEHSVHHTDNSLPLLGPGLSYLEEHAVNLHPSVKQHLLGILRVPHSSRLTHQNSAKLVCLLHLLYLDRLYTLPLHFTDQRVHIANIPRLQTSVKDYNLRVQCSVYRYHREGFLCN